MNANKVYYLRIGRFDLTESRGLPALQYQQSRVYFAHRQLAGVQTCAGGNSEVNNNVGQYEWRRRIADVNGTPLIVQKTYSRFSE
jgi:hypothetical protein